MQLEHRPDPFVLLPFRHTKEGVPDWTRCLKYITTNYPGNNVAAAESALRRMNSLQQTISKTCCDGSKTPPTESFVENTLMPYCKLVAMAQGHLPLYGKNIESGFVFYAKWSFDNGQKEESNNSNLELLSAIYNLAASTAYVASHQVVHGGINSIVKSFKWFQNAAGYYSMVESLLYRLPPELVRGDFTPGSLQLFQRVCLVMAHHCAYLKAEIDMKNNHVMLSKIAREGGKLYDEATAALLSSDWHSYCAKNSYMRTIEQVLKSNSQVFYARSHLHIAAMHLTADELGPALGHFEKAQDYLSEVEKLPLSELRDWISSIIINVNKEHEKALSLNASVFHCRVPNDVEAPVGLPRPLGKATRHVDFTAFESKRNEDPFFGIIPGHVVDLVSQWRERQRVTVNSCISKCENSRDRTTEMCQKLGVTAILEVLSGETKNRGRLPATLCEKIKSIRTGEGGGTVEIVPSLLNMVKRCDDIYLEAKKIMKQVEEELEGENQKNEVYLKSYGSMWRSARAPASETAEYMSIRHAMETHEQALNNVLVVPFSHAKGLMEANLRGLSRLDWSMSDLDALMPFAETSESRLQMQKVTDCVEALRRLMERRTPMNALGASGLKSCIRCSNPML
ncbi:BRO1 like domain [Trypanosoma vivax]|nr:BRO1 like domain [Trypanosoma vivax]